MKAEMNAQGQVVLTPENFAEQHALNAWKEGNMREMGDRLKYAGRNQFYQASALVVTQYIPNQ